MVQLDDFDRNARAHGILVDTNLLVLLIVGSVRTTLRPTGTH